MRSFALHCLFLLVSMPTLVAQKAAPVADDRVGIYRSEDDFSFEFHVSRDGDQLHLQVMNQGRLSLIPVSSTSFVLKGVRPKATLEFLKDTTGRTVLCRVHQKFPPFTWVRIGESSSPGSKEDGLAGLTGDYQLQPNPYRVFHITEKAGRLFGHIADQDEVPLPPLGHNRFRYTWKGKQYDLAFAVNGEGRAERLVSSGNYPVDLPKISSTLPHVSNRTNGFTHADTLLGALTPLRSCYDVLFYDLDLVVLPDTKSIRGSNLIRWRTVQSFRRMQIDLYANLHIDSILYHGREVGYSREENAVFIDLPATVAEGSIDELRIVYSGMPLAPDIDVLKGGIFWVWNREKKIWIESVTQGTGASVFWPCKDHLSDRPDSMRISVTVPRGLMDISNGRLLSRVELPGGQTRFEWYVDYPIVTYDVVINIGDYVAFSDTYVSGADSIPLHFYCMPYNLDSARKLFADAKRMLGLYEKEFGPYPFRRDGFTVMESIYSMEHQCAVSIGSFRDPFNSDRYDGGLRRMMWHESAHEWWGNSVGCSDFADMWIHESFADYAEVLNDESLNGRPAALKYLFKDHPGNKEPIIGVYNVNNFHMGDMYLKGSLLLTTLRDVIGNDSLWFTIFRTIQQRFRYQPVRTEDIIGVFNTVTGKDYTWFFDQYLRHPAIPVLALTFQQEGDRLRVKYKWEADVSDFRMPIKVTTAKDSFAFIYPTTAEQTMDIQGMTQKDFAVDTAEFYVGVRVSQ
ncbi:M1 family metallopeptidase [Puia dinghuensis]|uniref:Peptidase M1 membrane alanine aminopeptidase domain-containing protein n=1 Tax=Puia dinghuensis TaxID=1792502 RepID=A0A8J2XQY5_9BACT|nr:M1 family metallopeptidase [Puia dinghuensis]GGA86675.1 hypothetical protein GCM10011511_07170 [Puia dinghuensis]